VKKIFVIVLLAITTWSLQAQDSSKAVRQEREARKAEKRQRINTLLKIEEEQDPAFRKHSLFGIKAASDGYGISYEIGKYKGPKKALIFQAELNEKKNPKEQKIVASQNVFGQVNSVVWAKANNFFQFKLGIGEQRIIGGKANKNGVNVSAIYAGGISLGLLKPYFIDISANNNSGERKKVTFNDVYNDTSNSFANYHIDGASGITYGWSKLQLQPGAHAKLAMRFDYGRFNEMITAIEAGVNAEYYFKDVQQLVLQNNKKFFFNGYVTILFGRRKGTPR
jgi:hypothetical protein